MAAPSSPRFGAAIRTDPVLQAPLLELTAVSENPAQSLQVSIAPLQGSNLVQLRVGDHEVFACDRSSLKEGGWTGCFVLWPLPNRYNLDGRKAYEFDGREVSLDDIVRKEDDYFLIHGLVDDQEWEYDEPEAGPDSASVVTRIAIEPGSPLHRHFPWRSSLTLTYTLRADRLEVSYAATNADDRPMPHVFALHPYYALLAGPDGTRVQIPASAVMVADEQTVPTGEVRPVEGTHFDLTSPTPVGELKVDDVWTDLLPGADVCVEYDEPALRIRHVVTEDFTHAVYFTLMAHELGFVCLEPQTGSSNAINLAARAARTGDDVLSRAAHLLTVPPGGTQRGTAAFVVEHR